MTELLGTHNYALDPKGSVSLPQRFREAFADGVWLTVGQDRCLYVFPRAEWERQSTEVGASPLSDNDGRIGDRADDHEHESAAGVPKEKSRSTGYFQ